MEAPNKESITVTDVMTEDFANRFTGPLDQGRNIVSYSVKNVGNCEFAKP